MPASPSPDSVGSQSVPDRVVLTRHADVVAAALDPSTFSSAVSRHLQIPNGLDGEAHAAYRRLLDPFFSPDALAPLVAPLERLAATVLDALAARGEVVDAVTDLGARFAVRAQSLWLGWPQDVEDELLDWVAENRAASRAGDLAVTTSVARSFDALVRRILTVRREGAGADPDGADPDAADPTARLLALRTEDGRALSDAELVSILRNWTGGDLSSLALCTGVVAHWLATHPGHAEHLRTADDATLDAALDEILRLDDPFVSNRRVTTHDVTLNGCPVPAGRVVVLDWRQANRDTVAFGDADEFDPAGHAAANLVYGIGPHVCPGRPLATLELRVLTRAILAVGLLELDPRERPTREEPPVAGFRSVPVRLRRDRPGAPGPE